MTANHGMKDQRRLDELSLEELERVVYRRRRNLRRQRLQRLRTAGRLVEVPGRPPPAAEPPLLQRVTIPNSVSGQPGTPDTMGDVMVDRAPDRIQWRWAANKLLLFLEVGAVLGLLVMLLMLWSTRQDLNAELAAAQDVELAAVALPTPTATPVIGLVVLPTGHKVINGRAVPEEAGDIPGHLLPLINSYVPPPVPTPGPEQARRIQIPALGVDKPIVQGDDWEQLKKGVGQHIGSATPGQPGNLVLSAHNDVFGEIFRELDRLAPGDEILVSTERNTYRYIVRETQIVAPTAVEVMDSTAHASATLISCYPYLVNNKRIVVFADLVTGVDG